MQAAGSPAVQAESSPPTAACNGGQALLCKCSSEACNGVAAWLTTAASNPIAKHLLCSVSSPPRPFHGSFRLSAVQATTGTLTALLVASNLRRMEMASKPDSTGITRSCRRLYVIKKMLM